MFSLRYTVVQLAKIIGKQLFELQIRVPSEVPDTRRPDMRRRSGPIFWKKFGKVLFTHPDA